MSTTEPLEEPLENVLEGLRILIVYGSAEECAAYSRLFRHTGAAVTAASSVDEALRAFGDDSPEIVISHMRLRDGGSGEELIRAIRDLPVERGGATPAIAIETEQDAGGALDLGFSERLRAPVHFHELLGAVLRLTSHVVALRAMRARAATRGALRPALAARRPAGAAPRDAAGAAPRGQGSAVEGARAEHDAAETRPPLVGSTGNALLDALSPSDRLRVFPTLELADVEPEQTLVSPHAPIRAVYFPRGSAVSLLCLVESGKTVETVLVGPNGAVGLGAIAGVVCSSYWARVTAEGQVWRGRPADMLRLFDECRAFRALVLDAVHAYFVEAAQTATCIRAHDAEQQIARWLLTLCDRVGSRVFHLTHEAISERLGIRRATVSVILERFQDMGIVSIGRGRVRIADPVLLETASCECYGVVKQACTSRPAS